MTAQTFRPHGVNSRAQNMPRSALMKIAIAFSSSVFFSDLAPCVSKPLSRRLSPLPPSWLLTSSTLRACPCLRLSKTAAQWRRRRQRRPWMARPEMVSRNAAAWSYEQRKTSLMSSPLCATNKCLSTMRACLLCVFPFIVEPHHLCIFAPKH